MSDAFIQLVSIQPSAAVQPERGSERDELSQPQSDGVFKQGLYATRRKRGVTKGTSTP